MLPPEEETGDETRTGGHGGIQAGGEGQSGGIQAGIRAGIKAAEAKLSTLEARKTSVDGGESVDERKKPVDGGEAEGGETVNRNASAAEQWCGGVDFCEGMPPALMMSYPC